MKGLEYKSFGFNMKSTADTADGGCEIEGIVACFNSIDDCGDLFTKGCFTDFLPFFRASNSDGSV